MPKYFTRSRFHEAAPDVGEGLVDGRAQRGVLFPDGAGADLQVG